MRERLGQSVLAALLTAACTASAELPRDVEEIVFVARPVTADFHWYANFGYYALDDSDVVYKENARLCTLNVRTGEVEIILEDSRGGIRDPQVHYDGRRILFAYRKGGTRNYLIHEINADGSGLRQITTGEYDDIEPTYLPDGGIMFVSSRCKRWVNCWLTQVATLYRCDADGGNLHPVSGNTEHDNTPWPLPDGRVIYTRWEYIDRSQVDYHHLWAMNPDGTGQMVYYGNLHPGILMIDAKPIPGTGDVVAIFSPEHGRRAHDGIATIVSPKKGPDDLGSARPLSDRLDFRDPYPLSADCILFAQGRRIVAMNAAGETEELYRVPKEWAREEMQCHEPRPLVARPVEPVIPARTKLAEATGRLILQDIRTGRNMGGVEPGDVAKLLVLEALPMPIHYSGSMRPITHNGSFTLERIVGTVPVETDGSAYLELPAARSFFFVALDENDQTVKRMQSFTSVMPGETTSCVGCHESRTRTPDNKGLGALMALQRPPSVPESIEGIPDVYDFPRDIQPVLDRHCVPCHGLEKRAGNVLLEGDRGPMYTHSYYALVDRGQIADGRNKPESNLPPRTIGAVASPLMKKLTPAHHDVKVSPEEERLVRFWIEAGATYPGTYAAQNSGMIGHPVNATGSVVDGGMAPVDVSWAGAAAAGKAIEERCDGCHQEGGRLPRRISGGGGGRYSNHRVFNLTSPEKSLMLMAPLAKDAGGLGVCRQAADGLGEDADAPVFARKEDSAYQAILAMCEEGHDYITSQTWFRMAEFRPAPSYVREMKRYGILPAEIEPGAVVDTYAADRAYWESLWWRPEGNNTFSRERAQ